MFYRYKPRKKERQVLRFVVIALVAACAIYLGYRNKDYLMFWKYSSNKIETVIKNAENQSDNDLKRAALFDADKIVENYKAENPLEPESYYYYARLHYAAGSANLNAAFSELVINDELNSLPASSIAEFNKVIKSMRKGMALANGKKPNDFYMLTFAKACFFTKFLQNEDLQKLLARTNIPEDLEDIRFYAAIKIMGGAEEEGFNILRDKNIASDTEGSLFIAGLETAAGRYTSAIMNYKKLLASVTDEKILKLVRVNLGRIYYRQGLFAEAVEEFAFAQQLDASDSSISIWTGRAYLGLGQPDKAKAVWSAALALDNGNVELRKLLSSI